MKNNLILIVDDNPVNIQLLVNILESDYQLIIAKNGVKALESIAKNKPDLVLLDVKMPGMDGYQVCSEMKNNPEIKDIAIIFITAMTGATHISKGFDVGAVDYITKPFAAAEVKARVNTHLSLSEMRRNLSQQNLLLEQGIAEKTKALQTELDFRKKAEEDIIHNAYYDNLTDLPNRKLLLERLEQSLISSNQHHYYGAIIFVGLDRFKNINDSLSHSIGDDILIESAKRIKSCLFEEDTISRFGGDEFVLLLRHLGNNEEQANQAVKKITLQIQTQLRNVFLINKHEIYLTASLGIKLFPSKKQGSNELGSDEIIKYANTAMHSAKENGRNQITHYHPKMHKKIQRRLLLENELQNAILDNQLEVYYQPQISSEGRLIAVEALVRWLHPQRGAVDTESFIAVAEDTGLIYELGNFVLNQAVVDVLKLNKEHNVNLSLSVNISPYQFRRPEFTHCIKDIIDKYSLQKNFLTLELTERVAIDNITDTIDKINQLKQLGIRFSLDDFGTGYSSLSQLKKLPIDELKIDKSFIFDIQKDPQDDLLIQTIIKIGHQFGLQIVAEGVENTQQLKFLESEKCNIFQGYLYSKAVEIDKLNELVSKKWKI